MKISLIVGIFLLVSGIFPEEAKPKKYTFPLDIANGYSSAFQEFRSNHFHAGMDLRTFQKTGFPVYAIADGQLDIVRMVKHGSGKGLYIKHGDGNTSIYFHLDRFVPWIEKIVMQVQQSTGNKYFGNFSPKIPLYVKKGEVIAFSGETGYGFPHLHFEIRDIHNQAINPFPLLEFTSKDFNYPILRSVVLRSKSESLINGDIGEFVIPFDRINDSTYQLNIPVVTSGKFDLILNTRDISDSGKFVTPYGISFFCDGFKQYGLRFDRFSWEDNNQLGFVYDLFCSTPGNFFFNLFFQPGFELEEKKMDFDLFFNRLEPGRHEGTISVTDNFGNTSVGLFTFFKVERPEIEVSNIAVEQNQITMDIQKLKARSADEIVIRLLDKNNRESYIGKMDQNRIDQTRKLVLDGICDEVNWIDFAFQKNGIVFERKKIFLKSDSGGMVPEIDFETFINRDVVFIKMVGDCLTSEDTGLEVIQGGKSQNLKAFDKKDNVFFCFKPQGYENDIELVFTGIKNHSGIPAVHKKLRIIHLQNGIEQNFVDGDFQARFSPGAVREPKVLLFQQKNFDSPFPVLTRQISLYPYHFPFLDYVYFAFEKEVTNPRQVGIFNYDFHRKKWKYTHTVYENDHHSFKTKVISSGTFTLMRDIFPPVITLARLGSLQVARIKKLVVRITDRGMGVDDASLQVWMNRQPIRDCEYDPDWRHVIIGDITSLRPGNNTLKVAIQDYAGNPSSRIFQFYLK